MYWRFLLLQEVYLKYDGSLFIRFEALDAAEARYILVGGVAVNLYGHLRGTTDIDLVIDLAPEDARKTLAVLGRLEASDEE